MQLSEAQRKKIRRWAGGKAFPALLIHDGKHGDAIWLCNCEEDLVRAFRAMVVNVNKAYRYYEGDEQYLQGALAGSVADLLDFVHTRKEHEYEMWRVERPEKLHRDWEEPAAPAFEKGQRVFLDGKVSGEVQGFDDSGDLIVSLGTSAVIFLGEDGQKRLKRERK